MPQQHGISAVATLEELCIVDDGLKTYEVYESFTWSSAAALKSAAMVHRPASSLNAGPVIRGK